MVFRADSFYPIAGFENSDTPRLWGSTHVDEPADSGNAQDNANYFDVALTLGFDIRVGDFIYAGDVVPSSGSVSILGVTSIAGGVVVVNPMGTPV